MGALELDQRVTYWLPPALIAVSVPPFAVIVSLGSTTATGAMRERKPWGIFSIGCIAG